MKLTAAPVVRQPMQVIGAPGMTDFTRIYIASELNKPEYRTTLRHEQGHVWARHNARRPKDARIDLWRIACEMEIARTIYDERDIANITAPRSRLAGGYLPDTLQGLPEDIVLAEDIYEWLLSQPEQQHPAVSCGCSCDGTHGETDEQVDGQSAAQAAREQLDADETARESQVAAAAAYAAIRNRAPSLTEAVDAALRVRVERERSYRRPSRRHMDNDVVMPGAISIPRPPLVEIFVDRSGSFTPEKTAAAERQLSALLSRYGATIRADVWFFGNGRLVDVDPGGGGDTPYELVAHHLRATQPKLAVVITDNDPVSSDVGHADRSIKLVCVPIGCSHTNLAKAMGGVDVVTR
ncbi:IrrE N-terminal-like domain-containing protein [Cupriavidus oxalaticus]|uniref:hypothetical protein n=1 Tax=Cupriavidus oxalaticus TaxID=96344 RepID=UPI003F73C52D